MGLSIAPDFRRLLPARLAFGFSLSLTALALMAASLALSPLEPDATNDAPPLFPLGIAMSIFVAALVIGIIVTPFRDLFVRRSFPFLRAGYGAVAALPLAYLVLPGQTLAQRGVMIVGLEIYLLLSALAFVGFCRLFGVYGDSARCSRFVLTASRELGRILSVSGIAPLAASRLRS